MTYLDGPNPMHRRSMAVHATRRLYQRHGLAISHGEYWLLCQAIEAGRAPVVCKAMGGGTIHALNYAGRNFYAVWNPNENAIATVLEGVPREVRKMCATAGEGEV